MASIKVIFRASSRQSHDGTLYYRVIQKRKVRQIHTGIRISRDEWDESLSAVSVKGDAARQEQLRAVRQRLRDNLTRLERIVAALDRDGGEYSAGDVAERYLSPDSVVGFISFTRNVIADCREIGRASAADHYATALNSLIRFNGDSEIPFDSIDSRLIERYEQYLKGNGLRPNTISYYMRKLRAIYNIAVDRDMTARREPFRHVYTGVAKTTKRAVPIEVIRSLRAMDLTGDPLSALARDMFVFSFYTRGMSFIDMAYLTWHDIQGGILTYRRHKTGQELKIEWLPAMQEIVDRHAVEGSDYLLPLIKPGGGNARRQYLSAAHLVNRRLKKLGRRLGLPEPLTMYRARHSWASIARDNNYPMSIISQGMGHDSERTTTIYLSSIDASKVDKANSEIISLLDN